MCSFAASILLGPGEIWPALQTVGSRAYCETRTSARGSHAKNQAGGFVPYIAHRIQLTSPRDESKWKLAGIAVRRKQAVAQRMNVFQRFWYDTALSSTPAALPSLRAVADPTRILYGSDFPCAPALALKYMRAEYEDMDLPAGLRAGIDRRNAEALFPRFTVHRRPPPCSTSSPNGW